MGRKKLVIDEKVKRELLGALPFSCDCEHRFTPSYFLRKEGGKFIIPEEYHPVFYLSPMDVRGKEKAKSLIRKINEGGKEDTYEKETYATTAKYLVRWENLFDLGTGELIPHEPGENGATTVEQLQLLPPTMVGTLLFEITRISGLINLERLSLGL